MAEKSVVCLEKFIQQLTAGGGISPSPADCVEYGYQAGWLSAQDVLEKENPLLRKTAARILHEFLRREQKEADEVDGSPAYQLQDLFDCRICAGHIIQVYVKGIMDARNTEKEQKIFGTEEEVSEEEAEEILQRVFCPDRRKPRSMSEDIPVAEPEFLSQEQAIKRLQENPSALLLDVRNKREYEKACIKGAKHAFFMEIIKNPYTISENCDKMILIYCAEGYQSKLAAQCLLEAGYKRVAYFAWNSYEN